MPDCRSYFSSAWCFWLPFVDTLRRGRRVDGCLRQRRTIFLFGGGSAALASHLRLSRERSTARKRFESPSLTDNVPMMTAPTTSTTKTFSPNN
jgi:hypothetical protein